MIDLLTDILVVLFTFGLLVTLHEYGHFWVARRCGVKVLRFSIGFGKPLLRWTDRRDTEYLICVLPLGGYVKMLDEREGPVAEADLPRAFNRQPLRSRCAIVVAGPLANFLLAIAAYWLIFVGGVTGVMPLIGTVEEASIADRAGLVEGMVITSVDGEDTPTWRAVNQQLLHRIGESGELLFGVREQGSDLVYEHRARLQDWLVGAEEPNLIEGLGLAPWMPVVEPRIDTVVAASPAEQAGMQVGDLVISADEQPMADWSAWVTFVRDRPGQALSVEVERDGGITTLVLVPESVSDGEGGVFGRVGVSVKAPEYPDGLVQEFHYNPVAALGEAAQQTWTMTIFTLESIKKLLSGLISPKNLSGPITIAKVASASAESGLEAWLGVLALLSVSLAVLNLLPIPVLDGGHLLFYLVEGIKGSPLSERVQSLGFQVGLSMVLALMLFAIYNDISRL